MARTFLTPIDLAQNEIQNAVAQNLAAAPATPKKGQFYLNSTAGDDTLYWWDGTAWIPAKGTDAATVDAAIDAKVDDITIVTVPSTSLATVKTGSSATGDLTYTITLDSLTLANTFTGIVPPTPTAPAGEAGDLYIDTATGNAYINDGTGWVQLEAPASGVASVTAGAGAAVDNTTPSVPVVSVVIDPASDPLLTVSATGVKLGPAVVNTTELDAAIAAAIALIPPPVPTVAGAGLTSAVAGTLDVIAGNGVVVAADSVGVLIDPLSDPALTVTAAGLSLAPAAVGVRKFAQAAPLPAGIATPLNHGLNTTDVIVQVFDSTTGAQIEVDVKVLSPTQVSLTSTAAVSINVVVIG